MLVEDGHGLTDIQFINACRGNNIATTYQFKNEITRKTATVDFTTHLESGSGARNSVDVFHRRCEELIDSYNMKFNGNNTRRGVAATYGHAENAASTHER